MRTVSLPPGIGDCIWLISKLLSTGERFDFHLPDSQPRRGAQIFDMIPKLAASVQYVPGLSYRIVERDNAERFYHEWSRILDQSFCLSCNGHLERGQRIESYLPDLKMHYRIDWETAVAEPHALAILQNNTQNHLVGLYASSYAGSRNWGGWRETEWSNLASGMYEKNREFVFVIIGAKWDEDLASGLMRRLRAMKIPFINTIGEPLAVVTEILKRLVYFIGFPSGLSILNETLGKKTFMFYSEAIKALIETWAEPSRIASGDYKGCLFCDPKRAVDWIFDYYKLLDKI